MHGYKQGHSQVHGQVILAIEQFKLTIQMTSSFGILLLVLLISQHSNGNNNHLLPVVDGPVEVYPAVNNSQIGSTTTSLYFGLMVAPSEDSDYLNSTVSAVQLALDTINADPDLLRGYSLHYTLTTSQCSDTDMVDTTLAQLFGGPACKLGLIEAGCTAEWMSGVRFLLANQFNIPQITCSHTIRNAGLDVFEVSPANDVIVPALIELITHYNWTKLALITESEQKYSQLVTALKVLESLNVTLTVSTLAVKNHTLKVEVFNAEVRLYILAMSSDTANYLLCKAFTLGIKYPKFEFIFLSDHHSDWWVGSPQDDSHYGCTTEHRAIVLNHSLALQWRPNSNWDKHLTECSDAYNCKDLKALYCYDAVWTLALAIDKVETDISETCLNGNCSVAGLLYEIIQLTNFTGPTGRVTFGEDGVRSNIWTKVFVYQYQFMYQSLNKKKPKLITMGTYTNGKLTLVYTNATFWPSGVPYDGSPVHVLVTVSVPLTVVYYTLATVGIVFAVVCSVFNFVYRKTKVVRLSSPNLNYLITAGSVFMYAGTYWYFFPTRNPNLALTACCLQAWSVTLGYFLTMVTVVAKLYRIYYIFRNPESRKRTITDCHLFVLVIIVVTINALILTAYVGIEVGLSGYNLTRTSNQDFPSEIVGDREVDTRYELYTCTRVPNARTVFVGVIFVIIGLLMICALFMAIKTRNVKIKGLNDAKYIAIMVYISSFGAGVHLILNTTLRSYVNTFPAVLMGFSMIMITIIVGLVFIPKMINLYQDPNGEHIFSRENSPVSPGFQTAQQTDLSTSGVMSLRPKCQQPITSVKN